MGCSCDEPAIPVTCSNGTTYECNACHDPCTATSAIFMPGSIDLTLTNFNNDILATTTCIPGNLDTDLLENGDYINETIVKTFELLKTIKYEDSIIERIKYNLVAFNVSVALEQRITEYIKKLAQQVFEKTLNIEDFNQNVKNETKRLSDKFPDNYSFILNKVSKAIDDKLYILTNTFSSCDCGNAGKPEVPCGCNHAH